MGEQGARAQEASVSSAQRQYGGTYGGTTGTAESYDGGRGPDGVRVVIRQPAHRVRGWRAAVSQ